MKWTSRAERGPYTLLMISGDGSLRAVSRQNKNRVAEGVCVY